MRIHCSTTADTDPRPVRFEIAGRDYTVVAIMDQWYGREDTYFKVRADDGNLYILRHSPDEDVWSLESFRSS